MGFGEQERLDWLRLARSGGIGPVTIRDLIGYFGSAAKALEALPDLAKRGGGSRPLRLCPKSEAEREIAALAKLGARLIARPEPDYPEALAALEDAPPVITVKGRAELLTAPMIALVGARNASAAGCRFARQLAFALGQAGAAIVSGLARGVDSAAHDGALESGTIAVIAGGIDIVYPPENEDRQRAIAARGLLVAEQPPGVEPRARHFPYRNRIIAGLSLGTVVIEAALKSGSLHTARRAADFGREVMAVPGSPLDPRAQGCNQLIRDGATLVQNAEDVLDAIRPFEVRVVRQARDKYAGGDTNDAGEGERAVIHGLLGPTPVHVDELVRQSGLSASTVQTLLLELELAQRLERHAGGKVSMMNRDSP